LPPDPRPTPADVEQAAARITGIAVRSPLTSSPGLENSDGQVALKLETVQPTGSFKIRGAAARILALSSDERIRGVVTASTGNHGRAVAHVGKLLGIPVTVCVSVGVPAGKVAALRSLGCELVIDGDSQTVALENADRLVETKGVTLVHPFDDLHVIAGQGTIGLEIMDEMPDLGTLLVPLSGGGLAAGIAIAVKERRPAVRIVGISMKRGAVMAASLEAGQPVDLPEESTFADSLQGGIGLDNRFTFGIVRDLVDEVVLLDESEIWAGMRYALGTHRLVLEGGAAVGIAALLERKVKTSGDTVIICTGSNIEAEHLQQLAAELVRENHHIGSAEPWV
jgi:threonine dehydratase